VKERFYEENVYTSKFPKYHMKILLGVFKAKLDREDILKLITGNESLHEITNDNEREANTNFRNTKREYLKGKINKLQMNSKNKNIRDIYRGNDRI
jgi:hypothetical protein